VLGLAANGSIESSDFPESSDSTDTMRVERLRGVSEGRPESSRPRRGGAGADYDPGACSKPFKVTFTASLMPEGEIVEYICQESENSVRHLVGPAFRHHWKLSRRARYCRWLHRGRRSAREI